MINSATCSASRNTLIPHLDHDVPLLAVDHSGRELRQRAHIHRLRRGGQGQVKSMKVWTDVIAWAYPHELNVVDEHEVRVLLAEEAHLQTAKMK